MTNLQTGRKVRVIGMVFSIIVVCLNAGERLRETIDSIFNQTERDYEIIVKDGGSEDEATNRYLKEYSVGFSKETSKEMKTGDRIRVYRRKDVGIYDAMNQALQYVKGDYILFLNCGDCFYDSEVLCRVKEQIGRQVKSNGGIEGVKKERYIFYGNIFERLTGTFVQSNPVIDDFACYRNLPCHQACFYSTGLFQKRAFDTTYAVRADYEHFLWCYYKAHARTVYMPVTVALYEGGGFSETRKNEEKSKKEHREIVKKYMPASRVFKYRVIMMVTLAPIRTWIARNPVTAGIYQKMKEKLYQG